MCIHCKSHICKSLWIKASAKRLNVNLNVITDSDESAYREEVDTLTTRCQDNNLTLNISKTKEMIVDFRRRQEVKHAPLHINGSEVEKFSCFRFLGVNISNDLTWSDHFFCHVPDCFPSPITTSK